MAWNHIESALCEGQVWRIGQNGVTKITAYPPLRSGNVGCVRWIAVMAGDRLLAKLNPEYTAYMLYGESDEPHRNP